MSSNSRIYYVKLNGGDAHPSTALAFIAAARSEVRIATQDDIVNCVALGVKVEDVKAP